MWIKQKRNGRIKSVRISSVRLSQFTWKSCGFVERWVGAEAEAASLATATALSPSTWKKNN